MTSASIFSETVEGMKLKFGEEIEKKLIYQDPSPFRWDFKYFFVNSSLKWRRSRLTVAKLQALSPSYVLTRLNRHRPKLISLKDALDDPRRRKTPYMSRLRFHYRNIQTEMWFRCAIFRTLFITRRDSLKPRTHRVVYLWLHVVTHENWKTQLSSRYKRVLLKSMPLLKNIPLLQTVNINHEMFILLG